MDKEQIIQILSDASLQNGKTYEERCVVDSDFDSVADEIFTLHKSNVKSLEDENYELNTFKENCISNGDY